MHVNPQMVLHVVFPHHLVLSHVPQSFTQISPTLWNFSLNPQAKTMRFLPSCIFSQYRVQGPWNLFFNLLSQNEFPKHRSVMSRFFMSLLFCPVLGRNWEKLYFVKWSKLPSGSSLILTPFPVHMHITMLQ